MRSAHQNDIENVFPFILLALLYIGVSPDPGTASCIFKVKKSQRCLRVAMFSLAVLTYMQIFVGARIVHTISYLGKLPQPSRALSFAAGMAVNTYMATEIIKKMFFGL